ncbi:response regulator [Paenibacillus sp. J5C_2022]|uniref:response regulator transcription factor n=1 Tax=Paenibacillus sp. J5C2022 TaxID=2977129 RepID=UPI0021CE83B7|nr:response regulator [Paenibacillus sp. J5C2022]MCU6707528.1 response regulator [Paenibacillus sp. J5C2022]
MRLLIVDDEPVIRKGLLAMAASYEPSFTEIRTAGNGEDALRELETAQPDIVMTDIRMPRMDGLQLCKQMSERYPLIQTIVVSGYSDFDYAQKCIQYGVKHYLLKPVSKSDLFAIIDQLAQESNKGYIPVSRYMEWIGKAENCIWSQQNDELKGLMAEWRQYCLTASRNASHLKDVLTDCLELLRQKLQERSYTPAVKGGLKLHAAGAQNVMDQFEEVLSGIVEHLAATRTGKYKDPMEEARNYIDERLKQDLTLDEVADLVGLTPTYFSALFKKVTGETFVQYRIKKRMERAKEMLAIPHYRIFDIASEVGYEDYPHFTKTFKKCYGISPSDYRMKLGIR